MFQNKKIRKDMIQTIHPTSVTSLKAQCLYVADGDIDKAKELYNYFADGMDGLPLFDPQEPSRLDKVKSMVGDGVGWVKENQNEILQMIEIFKGLFGKKGGGITAAIGASPIDDIVGAGIASAVGSNSNNASKPLDPIN